MPEKEPKAYNKAIRALAVEEKASLFVPVCSPVASHYDARVSDVLPSGCFSWACSPQLTDELDDKVAFCRCPTPAQPCAKTNSAALRVSVCSLAAASSCTCAEQECCRARLDLACD